MMINPSLIKAIDALIRPARHLLLITHVAPDGDAVGSLLGLSWLLHGLGKNVTPACEDGVPELYRWLPGSEEVVRAGETGTRVYDVVISLDCGDLQRMGKAYRDDLVSIPLLNVDHHVTNTEFGSLNWIDPTSVATAEMVLTLADTLGWPVGHQAATCLLTGLVTDTRSFRTANVGPAALRATLRLAEAGASLSEVARQAFDQQPLAWVRLLGSAIAGLTLEDGILWTEVTRAMRRQWALGDDETSGMTNFLASVREADVVLLFSERDDGTIDMSFRAAPGYDVAQIALKLGGGGHPQAAGCTLTGDLAVIRGRVLGEVRRSVAEQRRAAQQAGTVALAAVDSNG
jgi:phosphoesterase RecJ-like protein